MENVRKMQNILPNTEDFLSFDQFLLKQSHSRIIHQIWFGTIPNKSSAKKAYISMKMYRDTWKKHNKNWIIVEWSKKMCENLVKNFYKEHHEMYKNYSYEIQRCDAVRYMILHRYGGWYADMDYICNRPFEEVGTIYKNNIYLVQSPNSVITQDSDHISNSLMFSEKNHAFWKQVLLDMEKNQKTSYFFTKHIHVMFTTGPGILNKIYSANKYKYNVKSLPWKLFHPYGMNNDIRSLNLDKNIFAAHIGKSTWIGKDTVFLQILLKDWKILVFILSVMILCVCLIKILKK